MPHIKRLCWLLAWGVWVWLGFGLYRELPRDLGPVVCRLPLAPDEVLLGFVGDEPAFATQLTDRVSGTSVSRTWDPWTGALRREFGHTSRAAGLYQPATRPEFLRSDRAPSDRSQVLTIQTGVREPSTLQWRREPTYLLDLAAERWLDLAGDGAGPVFHPRNPWAIFWFGGGRERGENYVVVVDLRSGRRLFEWREGQPSAPGMALAGEPYFVGDDRIAVPGTLAPDRTRARDAAARVVEVWSIPPGERPLTVLRGVDLGEGNGLRGGADGLLYSSSASGRVAYCRGSDFGVDVFDTGSGRRVFSEPRDAGANLSPGYRGGRAAALTADGKSMLNVLVGRLYEVDAGRVIWSTGTNESITWIDEPRRFEVSEEWNVGSGAQTKRYWTFAVRRLADGALEYRSWHPTLRLSAAAPEGRSVVFVNSAPREYGSIRELSPRVNWSLLVLCQAVLALPLVLLWMIVRRRRT